MLSMGEWLDKMTPFGGRILCRVELNEIGLVIQFASVLGMVRILYSGKRIGGVLER